MRLNSLHENFVHDCESVANMQKQKRKETYNQNKKIEKSCYTCPKLGMNLRA